jgi:hypothetical protein
MRPLSGFLSRHKTIVISLAVVFLYSSGVALAVQVAPGTVLDPAGLPGAYTVGPVLSYGEAVTTSHDNEILYIDSSGDLVSDDGFTRDSNQETVIGKSSGTQTYGFFLNNDFGLGGLEASLVGMDSSNNSFGLVGVVDATLSGGGPQSPLMTYIADLTDPNNSMSAVTLGDDGSGNSIFALETTNVNANTHFYSNNTGNEITWDADTTDDIQNFISQNQDILGYGIKGGGIFHQDTVTAEASYLFAGDKTSVAGSSFAADMGYLNPGVLAAGFTVGSDQVTSSWNHNASNLRGYSVLNDSGYILTWDADTTNPITDVIAQGQTLATIFKGNIIQHKNATTGENASLIVADGSAGSLSPYIAGLSYTNATSPTLIIQSIVDASRVKTRYRDVLSHIDSELILESTGNTFSWDADTTDDIESIITQGENLAGAGIKGTGIMHSDTNTTSSVTTVLGDVSSVFSVSDFAMYTQSTDASGQRHGEQFITSDTTYGVRTRYFNTGTTLEASNIMNESGNVISWDADTSDDIVTTLTQNQDLFGLGQFSGSFLTWEDTGNNIRGALGVGDGTGAGLKPGTVFLSSANTVSDETANMFTVIDAGVAEWFASATDTDTDAIIRANSSEGVRITWNENINDDIIDSIQMSGNVNGFGLDGIGILHVDTSLGTLVSGLFAGDASALGLDTNISYISSGSILAAVNQSKFFTGDLLGAGNNTMFQVNDSNQKIKSTTGGQFIVADTADGELFEIDAATRYMQLGDIAVGGNGTLFTVDDANQLITISAAGSASAVFAVTNSDGTCTLDPGDVSGLACPSDENLKKDITTLDAALNNILALRPVTYRLKTENETSQLSTGLIAQEVQQIFPTLVKTQRDSTLALNYGGLTPFIIKAIQELDIKVTAVTGLTEESGIREALRGWLSDTANGITEFFAGRVKTNELCVGSVCVTESQFLQMVQQSGQTGGSSSSGTVVSGGGSSDTGDQTIEGDLTSDTQGTPDENSDSTGDPENSPASEPTETI